jgi:hypothetical protein
MSCCKNEQNSCSGGRLFIWVLLLAAGAVVIACVPEIKRYIKISNM